MVYTSQTFPTTGYGVVNNLHPDLQDKVREAFFGFDWEGTASRRGVRQERRGPVHPDHLQGDWAVIRTIDDANGVEYDCN